MTDWAPQVVRIETVIHHPDADVLDVVTVLGDYPVITKRDEYKVGDLAGYIPIDSIVPDTDQFYFLCPKSYEKYEEDGAIKQRQVGNKFPVGSVPEKNRIIKAKKLRGIYSQGMLVPIGSWLNDTMDTGPAGMGAMMGLSPIPPYNVGDSIVEWIGLKKWEEPEEDNLPTSKFRTADQAAPPKGWTIPHYDIDGVRKYIDCLAEGEEIVLTEKLHGSNGGFCHDGDQLWVKSRNFYKKMDEDDMWWDIAIRYDLENKLKQAPKLVFFGEVHGQIKGFRYDATLVDGKLLTKVRFFDVYDTVKCRYLDYDDRIKLITDLGLDPVPELYKGQWLGKEEMYKFAEGLTTIGGKHIREGWVLNTRKERYEPKLNSRMQVKLVGEAYNLQK